MYSLKGEIKVIGDVQQITDTFKKRDVVVLDASGQYPQTILFQLAQDRCDLVNNMKVGDLVETVFFLRGREWTNPEGVVKYFNSLDLWKIDTIGGNNPQSQKPPQNSSAENSTDGDDDLPF